MDAEKTRADDVERKCKELQDELTRVKGQLKEQDEAKIIENFKVSEAFDQEVADAGDPDVLRCWLVAEKHIKTDPAVDWNSFIEDFLKAKDDIEKGLGEPAPYNSLNPAFLLALEDQAP